jgi:L-aminopeptidase/D-esterase-like protein
MDEIGINDIPGFRIGHAQNPEAATGCTVIICGTGAVCGVDVRGGSPVTRDTDALDPINNREKVHAILLAGGSSFGLDAAAGAMKFLEEQKIGRDVGITTMPNICAAVLFDLKCGSHKIRPDEKMGYAACENAYMGQIWKSGNYGAGAGATVGSLCGYNRAMKGGVGSHAIQHGELKVGAVVAVNCAGDVLDTKTGEIIAGARTADGTGFENSEAAILNRYRDAMDIFSGSTIIG